MYLSKIPILSNCGHNTFCIGQYICIVCPGDRPSAPGTPGLQFFGSGIYKVVWEAPHDNGAPIELYSLESLTLRWYRNKRSMSTPQNRSAWFANAPSVEEEPDEETQWEEVYNGTGRLRLISIAAIGSLK